MPTDSRRIPRLAPSHRPSRLKFLLLFVVLFWAIPPAFAQTPPAEVVIDSSSPEEQSIDNWKYKEGDDSSWSAVELVDTGWTSVSKDPLIVERKGIHWLRAKIVFGEGADRSPVILRLGRIQSAYEVFWNGTPIGSSGRVAQRAEDEQPGRLDFASVVDSLVRPGDNFISVRFSNHHSIALGNFFHANIETTLHPGMLSLNSLLLAMFSCAIYLACALFGLGLYLTGGRYRNFLYYSLFCAGFLLATAIQFGMHRYNVSMGMLGVLESVFVGAFFLAEASIALFVLHSFQIPRARYHVAFVLVAAVTSFLSVMLFGFESQVNVSPLRQILTPYVLILLVYSCQKKKPGSYAALVAYAVYSLPVVLIGHLGLPIDHWFFFWARITLILVFIMVANRQVHEQQNREKALELRSQRLETELLKMSIQPHFVINTLASIRSLARTKPDHAEKLINALAAEFRILNSIASDKEVSIQKELELCDRHLQVMGYRWDATYTLERENVDNTMTVPPLIFHTLIENGLTHAFQPKENGTFRLSAREVGDCIEYTLRNGGSLLEAGGNGTGEHIEEGTGIKYVRMRLEERYPGKWELRYGMVDSCWNTVITIRKGRS